MTLYAYVEADDLQDAYEKVEGELGGHRNYSVGRYATIAEVVPEGPSEFRVGVVVPDDLVAALEADGFVR